MSATATCARHCHANSLRAVQNVKVELVLVLNGDELDAQLPLGVASRCNGIEEVTTMVVGVLAVCR